MNKDKKYRLYGFIIPVMILFYTWHISTYGGISIRYFDGDFASFMETKLWWGTFITPTAAEYIMIILYILLNVLSWIYRDKTANIIKKIFNKL